MTRLFILAFTIALGTTGAAFAQSNSATNSNAAGNTATTGNAATTDNTGHEHMGGKGHEHSSAMQHHARHHTMASAGQRAGDRGETAYRSALRRCVQGPSDARDSCLDQAIAQHQRG